MRRSITAIVNEKGGVAKTTSAVTLAHDLARKGHVVALVDLDAQGNASPCLGLKPAPGLYELLLSVRALPQLLVEARPNLWLLPSDSSTAKLKTILAGESYRELLLAKALEPLEAEFVILDTGPSRDLLHDMAHHAADQIVCPVMVDHLALIGVAQELETLKVVRSYGHPIEILAILPTFWDSITKESSVNLQRLVAAFGDLVLPAVPRTTRLRECTAFGRTPWEYLNPDHPAWSAYERLTRRVLDGQ